MATSRLGQETPGVVLVTTTDLTAARLDELQRLIASVGAFRESRPAIPVAHHLLLQRCTDTVAGARQIDAPGWMTVTAVDRQISLSAARNRMLDAILSSGLADDAIIAFPDDDAWYPVGTLEHVAARFEDEPQLDFWFCRYGTKAAFDPGASEIQPSLQNVLSSASSNTTVLRGSVLKAIGGFDESLGLGTPARSGEDTEFALRAYFASRKVRFSPVKMIGHRDYTPHLRAHYFGGATVAIARHARRSLTVARALVRKLAAGFVFALRQEMKLSDYIAVLGMIRADRAALARARATDRSDYIRYPGEAR